ncbi:MAG: hypothetical protein ACK4EZ_01635 [Fervidobacterium pennivorans]|uniref:Uncharacterized protein n=1 Tax=Fervidobacterium pennivorans TaxID=93466 RepID=A0A7C4W4Q5_FERPE|nr:hypothetical protein [Fervidobacterium pennivorans]
METRQDIGGVRIKRPLKISWVGTCAWIVFVQGVVLGITFAGIQIPDESLDAEVLSVIKKWMERPQIVVFEKNIAPHLSLFITKELTKAGFFATNIISNNVFDDETKLELISTTTSVDVSNVVSGELLKISVESTGDTISLTTRAGKIVFESEEDFKSGFLKYFSTNTSFDHTTTGLSENTPDLGPETLVYDSKSHKLYITVPTGIPLIVVPEYINFVPAVVTMDGSFYKNKVLYMSEKIQYQVDSLPFLYTGYSILTENYILNLRTGKKEAVSSVPIFGWDKYIIYADGSVGDLSLTWKLKVSNTPLDFLMVENMLYLLDVTKNVYAVNLKTRKVIFAGTFEDAICFDYDEHSATVILRALKENYVLSVNGSIKVDRTESFFKNDFPNKRLYPTFTNVKDFGFGFFYEGVYLGNSIFFMFISKGVLNIVTDVGTWQVKITKKD